MTINETNIQEINFDKGEGLVPAIIQDQNTFDVLMLGYMNAGAVIQTLETRKITFWSRSKGRLWTKGETSGHFLNLDTITLDCDQDTLLIKAVPQGPTCHTGADTCFGEQMGNKSFLSDLYELVLDRKLHPKEGSYTNHLFDKGINKIAQKVGEEAVELVIEAKDDDKSLFLNEAADLLYHLQVLLVEKGYTLKEVEDVLKERHR